MKSPDAAVIKFGGSIAVTEKGVNREYIGDTLLTLLPVLLEYQKIGLGIGGGKRAELVQAEKQGNYAKNMAARKVMWEHAEQVRDIAQQVGLKPEPVIPHAPKEAERLARNSSFKTLVTSWLREGQSSDTSALSIAQIWQEQAYQVLLVILSNVDHIYTADPRIDSAARPVESSSVKNLVRSEVLVSGRKKFTPRMHATIDPVAVSRLKRQGLEAPTIYFGHGEKVDCVREFLEGKIPDQGTILSPQHLKTKLRQR